MVVADLGGESRILLGGFIRTLDLEDQRHQRLCHETTAIEAEMAALVGTGAIGVDLGQVAEIHWLPAQRAQFQPHGVSKVKAPQGWKIQCGWSVLPQTEASGRARRALSTG